MELNNAMGPDVIRDDARPQFLDSFDQRGTVNVFNSPVASSIRP
jgi:hypothetical protein